MHSLTESIHSVSANTYSNNLSSSLVSEIYLVRLASFAQEGLFEVEKRHEKLERLKYLLAFDSRKD